MSSFVPVESQSSQARPIDSSKDTRKLTSEQDSLFRDKKAPSSDIPFKLSELKLRNSIPPPNERDIVRKNIQGPMQGSVRVDSPLGSRTLGEIRSQSPAHSLKVNSTGLPQPPSQSGGLPRSKVR